MIIKRGGRPNMFDLESVLYEVPQFDDILIVCIGTDKNIADSLGPMVGTMLSKYYPTCVQGTLEAPIHAMNIHKFVDDYYSHLNNCLVIAIDATLSDKMDKYDILVEKGSVKPGAGTGKNLPHIGDIKVCGCVGKTENSLFDDKSTRLYDIYRTANQITEIVATLVGLTGTRRRYNKWA